MVLDSPTVSCCGSPEWRSEPSGQQMAFCVREICVSRIDLGS